MLATNGASWFLHLPSGLAHCIYSQLGPALCIIGMQLYDGGKAIQKKSGLMYLRIQVIISLHDWRNKRGVSLPLSESANYSHAVEHLRLLSQYVDQSRKEMEMILIALICFILKLPWTQIKLGIESLNQVVCQEGTKLMHHLPLKGAYLTRLMVT